MLGSGLTPSWTGPTTQCSTVPIPRAVGQHRPQLPGASGSIHELQGVPGTFRELQAAFERGAPLRPASASWEAPWRPTKFRGAACDR